MRKSILVAAILLSVAQLSFAQDAPTTVTTSPAMTGPTGSTPTTMTTTTNTTTGTMTTMPMPCKNIVDACSGAGFAREGGPGKQFWKDCMKPLLMGQTVTGVTVDPNDVLACRQKKTVEMQKELEMLQQPMPTTQQ